jgi:hypothetical protein
VDETPMSGHTHANREKGTEIMTSLNRAIRYAGVLAAFALLVFAGAAHASATVGTFFSQDQLSGTETGIVGCYPDLTGTLSGTDTVSGQFVATDAGIHFRGTEIQDYRVDFENGWYLLSYSPMHFDVNANFGSSQFESTNAQQDRGTLYAANGQVIGPITVQTVTHITWRDLNNNGIPDPGEVSANVSIFRLTCP